MEVDLNDLRPEIHIFDVLGGGGAAHLHLAKTKSQTRYLGAPNRWCFLTKIRNAILQNIQSACANTDTREGHSVFVNGELGREIAPGESAGGWGALLKLALVFWKRLRI